MDYIKVGKVINTFGLEGKIIIKHNLKDFDGFKKSNHLFIELNRESYIPYFIEEHKKVKQEEEWLKLEDVLDLESAKLLLGKNIFLEKGGLDLINHKGVNDEIIGFIIIDSEIGTLGIIEAIYETPGQTIAVLTYKDKELLIPLLDQTILEIDSAQQQIKVKLPDGLLDIYL